MDMSLPRWGMSFPGLLFALAAVCLLVVVLTGCQRRRRLGVVALLVALGGALFFWTRPARVSSGDELPDANPERFDGAFTVPTGIPDVPESRELPEIPDSPAIAVSVGGAPEVTVQYAGRNLTVGTHAAPGVTSGPTDEHRHRAIEQAPRAAARRLDNVTDRVPFRNRASTGQAILITVGVLIVAMIVLKTATRRHTGTRTT